MPAADDQPTKPGEPKKFRCPYCGTDLPEYIFDRRAQKSLAGVLEYITVFCGEPQCRKILGVTVMRFVTAEEMANAARQSGLVI